MKNMGDGRRVARVESEVLRLVAQYIIVHMRDELPGIVTVSRVKMPADLRTAKVFVSIINFEGKFSEVTDTLQARASDMQRFINDNLRMRYCPRLTFMEDEVTQKVLRIESIIQEIAKDSKTIAPTQSDDKLEISDDD
jgi:ribosome-binding factor A